ncbi:MAG: DNA polymerase III subunit gamma/tau [Clostridia bacterium]|nr:DNA polymerase III subunit gamma/tau [Clostridia bacterium]
MALLFSSPFPFSVIMEVGMSVALYRKYRPKSFDDVVGQEHITSVLKNEIQEGKTSHAYLFCGSRGTGKTTCAKILARALNCENPVNGSPCGVCPVCRGMETGSITDIVEMDAASNNGVSNIRDIRDGVLYAPTACRKRVFIIDEVHMLTVPAFNALLKTLEEPPEFVVFILATTEMQKIPATVLSRCQRFDFHRIGAEDIAGRLRSIVNWETEETGTEMRIGDDILHMIATTANGGMRDAIGMLELCLRSSSDLTKEQAARLIGVSTVETSVKIVCAVLKRQIPSLFSVIEEQYGSSLDIKILWGALLSFYRDMLVCKTVPDRPERFLDVIGDELRWTKQCASAFSLPALLRQIRILDDTLAQLQRGTGPSRIVVEMALVRLCDATLDTDSFSVLTRLSELEERISSLPRGEASQPIQGPASSSVPVPEGSQESPIEEPSESEQSAPSGKDEQSVPFSRWTHVVDRLRDSDVSLYPFFRNSRAFLSEKDGTLRIETDNLMLPNLIDLDPTFRGRLVAKINTESGERTFAESDLSFTVVEKIDDAEASPLDELIASGAFPES